MALPGNHTIKTLHLTAYCASVGATPSAAYLRIPFRCQILKVTSVLGGAITTANASVAAALNGGSASFTHTIVQSGSAAGQLDSTVPASNVYANEDDVLSLTPSGAGGASIPAYFSVVVRQY